MSTALKTAITSNYADYEGKNKDSAIGVNKNNYVILLNKGEIEDSDGRRYLSLDLNPDRIGDLAFFKHIINQCYNFEVGEAFNYYLIDNFDISKFSSDYIPLTDNKLRKIADRLNPVY